jgi:hypothetical protein
MSIAERVELGLIVAVAAAFSVGADALPERMAVGNLLLGASALILLQSLLRDLWLLAKARRNPPPNPPRTGQCMCVESTVGITGVVAGLILVTCRIGTTLPMGRWSWCAFALASLGTGFLMKDYVAEFKPLRIRRDKDHVNIIVRWRR